MIRVISSALLKMGSQERASDAKATQEFVELPLAQQIRHDGVENAENDVIFDYIVAREICMLPTPMQPPEVEYLDDAAVVVSTSSHESTPTLSAQREPAEDHDVIFVAAVKGAGIVPQESASTQQMKREIEDDDDVTNVAVLNKKSRLDAENTSTPESTENDEPSTSPEEDIPFVLSQDEIWETAQKLRTFTNYELLKILFIIHAHGQLPTDGTGQVDVFALEPNCLREVYRFVEMTWMQKLKDANLLPPSDDESIPEHQG